MDLNIQSLDEITAKYYTHKVNFANLAHQDKRVIIKIQSNQIKIAKLLQSTK